MKAIARIVGVAAFAGAVLAMPGSSGAESLGTMRVRLVEGDVQMRIAETGEWAPVAVNTPLLEGDAIWVPDGSRAALETSDGSHVRLGENTALDILRMDRDSFQFYLDEGRAYVLDRAPRGAVLQIDTPDASIRAFRQATFRIDVPGGETDVAVFNGSVLAESDAGTTKVRRGEMLVLAPDGYAELSPLPAPDDWERWNRERDRIDLAGGASTRYLPAELDAYSGDFDDYGRWVYVQEYGYCWTPTVVVIRDWAPYRYGRWVWRGADYVWIGYEPWGWAPYHYGRWTFVARIGWCWVPPPRGEVYWGPGYVGWVRTPEYVAWVPLAPREIYYGHGDYGRYSVNVTHVNVADIRVTNVYRNVNVANSVTVVNQTTFVTGRPVQVARNVVETIREDFTRRRNIVVGRPPIRPVGASHVPVIREVPDAKRPPAAVRRIDVRQLRQSRPLVRESDRSAIRPEAKPRPLDVRKVEKARPLKERVRERREAPPAERQRPRTPQGRPPEGMERGRERPPATPPAKTRPGAPPAPTGVTGPQEPGRRERAVETAPPERGRRETRPGATEDRRIERPPERPKGPARERIGPEAAPPADAGERGGRNANPPAPAVRGRRETAPAVRTAPSPPPQPEREIERRKNPETPVERPLPRRPDDNSVTPEAEPGQRGERGRR